MVAADPQLRGQWLAGAGEMLRRDPVTAAPLITAAAGESWGIAQALDEASHYDPEGWGASLEAEQSLAVLALTRVCGWQTSGVQRIVAGIARTHPRAVLDMLSSDPAEALTVGKVDGLPEALASHEAVLVDWLHRLAAGRDDEWRIARLLPVTLGISLTHGAARAVVKVVTSTGAEDLLRLVRMLWLCDGFTVTHPDLVVALLARGEEVLDGNELEEMKQLLVVATVPRGGRWSPAAADETHIARLGHALQLTQDMSLPASARTIFSEGAAAIQAVMDEEARQWRDDED